MCSAFAPASWLQACVLLLALGLRVAAGAQDGVFDAAGRNVSPLTPGVAGPATVLVFTAVDCPISNRYAPELTRLATRYAARGVRFWLVYPNATDSADAMIAHARAFGYPMPAARDLRATLVTRAGVSVTPETAVFDRAGRLVYHGRIDDRVRDFGIDRPEPSRHDLAEALDAVLAGRPVTVPFAPAVGCTIVREP